jgi:hypothetical protein
MVATHRNGPRSDRAQPQRARVRRRVAEAVPLVDVVEQRGLEVRE